MVYSNKNMFFGFGLLLDIFSLYVRNVWNLLKIRKPVQRNNKEPTCYYYHMSHYPTKV